MTKFTKDQVQESKDYLLDLLKPGQTVYTSLHSVSRSGMSRNISVHVVVDGAIRDITWHVARAAGFTLDSKGYDYEIKMGGCGMDMGFALVYGLSRSLFPNGHKCTGSTGYTPSGARSKAPRCPSNDHSNDYSFLARQYDNEENFGPAPSEYGENAVSHAEVEQYVSARQDWIKAQDGRMWSKRRNHSDGGYALSHNWI